MKNFDCVDIDILYWYMDDSINFQDTMRSAKSMPWEDEDLLTKNEWWTKLLSWYYKLNNLMLSTWDDGDLKKSWSAEHLLKPSQPAELKWKSWYMMKWFYALLNNWKQYTAAATQNQKEWIAFSNILIIKPNRHMAYMRFLFEDWRIEFERFLYSCRIYAFGTFIRNQFKECNNFLRHKRLNLAKGLRTTHQFPNGERKHR